LQEVNIITLWRTWGVLEWQYECPDCKQNINTGGTGAMALVGIPIKARVPAQLKHCSQYKKEV